MLNVMDDYNRQVLWIETDTSLPALRVIRVLDQLKESRGLPEMIRVDNRPEFISRKFDHWCKNNHVTLGFYPNGQTNTKRTHRATQWKYSIGAVKCLYL
jgi:putative transposase